MLNSGNKLLSWLRVINNFSPREQASLQEQNNQRKWRHRPPRLSPFFCPRFSAEPALSTEQKWSKNVINTIIPGLHLSVHNMQTDKRDKRELTTSSEVYARAAQ